MKFVVPVRLRDTPCTYFVLCFQRVAAETKSKGGILIPEKGQKQGLEATIMAVGPGFRLGPLVALSLCLFCLFSQKQGLEATIMAVGPGFRLGPLVALSLCLLCPKSRGVSSLSFCVTCVKFVSSEAGAGGRGHHHGHRARLQVRSLGRLVSFVSREEASPQKQGPSFRLGSLVTQFLLSLSFTLVQRSRDLVSSQSLCLKS